jgi:hypothetical protein
MCGGRGIERVWRQRQRTTTAGKWRWRSHCCAAAEEKQLHSKAMEDGGRRRAGWGGVFTFCEVESYLQSYPLKS